MADNSGSGKGLYFIVGALVIAVLVIGYFMMAGQADKPDLAIDVDEGGIQIETDN
ncbi:hypothetical protein [Robiginitomaculum antarcticum]|uniref:hypothetical protein n=1 Tax=Robiginitomaculum antarcticum TaxID=437507 RepID=UPI00037F6824|nr:hypothetical protein [Robiginitomaculum antarcticum]